MKPFNPYEVLGIEPGDDVKAAYRKRARETHPDRGGSAEEFEIVHRAYKLLTTPIKKRVVADLFGARPIAGKRCCRREWPHNWRFCPICGKDLEK